MRISSDVLLLDPRKVHTCQGFHQQIAKDDSFNCTFDATMQLAEDEQMLIHQGNKIQQVFHPKKLFAASTSELSHHITHKRNLTLTVQSTPMVLTCNAASQQKMADLCLN